MKLVKLSLAAIVAAGAMTTFASATPLEEAIKGVEVSGMARYRFYHQSDAWYENDNEDNVGHQANRFSAELNIVSPITDNIKFGATLATNNWDYAADEASDAGDVKVDKFWFQYAINDFSIKAGKMEIPTPWTESGFAGTRGNGALALYTGVPNWAFAAAYFNQVDGIWDKWGIIDTFGEEDLMALAAIGSYDSVGLQAWVAKMTNLIDYTVFIQTNVNFSGFNALAQMSYLKLDDYSNDYLKSINAISDDSGIFMGFTAGYKNDNFFVEGGYTRTDKDMGIYSLTPDDDSFIKFGQQLYYESHNENDTEVFFVRGGFNYNKFGFEAGYGISDQHAVNGYDYTEYYGLASYQVAKNFSLQAYYSILEGEGGPGGNNDDDNKEFRFQALYSF